MKGSKEILVSSLIGLATFSTLNYVKKSVKSAERRQNETSPTEIAGVPEDPALSPNWGLKTIDAAKAWRMTKGSKNIVVAIIDTGCDVAHPDLSTHIWRNPGETGLDENGDSRATNGLDDDGNGFVDDFQGWNFAAQNSDITDEHGHGTHIAGITSGVAPDVSLMILKYYDTKSSGSQNLTNTVKAIRYAVDMGANIINYSGGGILKSADEEEAIRYALDHNVLVVAAAGNEGLNSDFFHFYPADYDLPNILSVGAVDRNNHLLNMSNFGINTVDLAAPGKNIYSTLPNGQYGFMSGTSQATAFASGIAALLLSFSDQNETPEAVIQRLLSSGKANPHLRVRTRGGFVLNAASVLESTKVELAQRSPARHTN